MEAYNLKEQEVEGAITQDVLLGQMRCLEALGEWSQLHTVSREHWAVVGEETRQKMARMSSAAAWGKQEWTSMLQSVSMLPRDSQGRKPCNFVKLRNMFLSLKQIKVKLANHP